MNESKVTIPSALAVLAFAIVATANAVDIRAPFKAALSLATPGSQAAAIAGAGSGLVGHWTFDDGTAADSSGRGNNGAIFGATPTAGKIGQALSFDGVNDKVTFNYLEDLDFSQEKAFTLAFWVRPNGGSGTQTIFSRGSVQSANANMVYHVTSSGYALVSDGTSAVSATAALSPGVWQHFSMVWDGSALSLYRDGSPVTSVARSLKGVWYKIGEAAMGVDSKSSRYYFSGSLDDVRAYNRALSAAEVSELYAYTGAGYDPNAPIPVPGACGASLNLCSRGGFSDSADSSTQYIWSCGGIDGGEAASCSLPIPAGSPPFSMYDRTNPIWYDNDDVGDVYTDEYLMALASAGEIRLVGMTTSSTIEPYNVYVQPVHLEAQTLARERTVELARQSGFKNIPDPLRGPTTHLVKPASGLVEDTARIGTPGTMALLQAVYGASESKPLVVVAGGTLTIVADAYLHALAEGRGEEFKSKVVVGYVDGKKADNSIGGYNSWADGWAASIVLKRLNGTFFPVSNDGYETPYVPKARLTELPDTPLRAEMIIKHHPTNILPNEHDYDAQPAVAIMLAGGYLRAGDRISFSGYKTVNMGGGVHEIPTYSYDSNGNFFKGAVFDSNAATEEWWRALNNPLAYQGATPPPPPPPPPPAPSYGLTVVKSGTGSGTVNTAYGSESRDSACTPAISSQSSVTLTAMPAQGSSFGGWSGGGCSGTGLCALNLAADTTVTAIFNAVCSVPAP